MMVHYDCRHFLGYKPCVYHRACEGCPDYDLVGLRVLIVKLAATGDVLRTTPLLRGLKNAHPDCHISWITDPEVVPLMEGTPGIDRLLPFGFESALALRHEKFDRVYCFDKESRAIALAAEIQGGDRFGFGMNRTGKPEPANAGSEYAFELGINNELKYRINRKTYPELIFECALLPYPEPQEYVFPDLSPEIAHGCDLIERLGSTAGRFGIGLNTGASDLFATKKWTMEGYAALADLLGERLQANVFLLGGPAESERNRRIADLAARRPFDAGTGHSLRRFAGIIGNLDLLITGDTLAMHLAIGLRIPVLAIFGPTCHQEIELYGRGDKIISDLDCSPCYRGSCTRSPNCMEVISAMTVYERAARLLQEIR
jgi:heptosyltransferase-2